MKQNVIISPHRNGVMGTAVRHLSDILTHHAHCAPICMEASSFAPQAGLRPFFLRVDSALSSPEGYCVTVKNDEVHLVGHDENGVLYAVMDFEKDYLLKARLTHSHMPYFRDLFAEALPDAAFSSAPAIRDRGLWTWGHVILDYRGYLDNMVRAKLNTLIVWNDFVPVNAKEVVSYAHDCGIKFYWGFSWCWDTDCNAFDLSRIDEYVDNIVKEYETTYAHLGGDGIYFQSFTELHTETIGGVLIADAVTQLVNRAAGRILDKYPGLDIQFGLHATSVRERLDYIARTDPRVRITWEDCGAFPYAYLPEHIDGFEETCDFTRKLLTLRGRSEKFGTVLKGFTCLDWLAFEHLKGPALMGAAPKEVIEATVTRKKEIWRVVQAYWLRNAAYAHEMIRLIASEGNADKCITALVEDGGFEARLPYPVAIWAQMLWNPSQDLQDILCDTALRPDVSME